MTGNANRVNKRQHRRVVQAVEHAERVTGVQFCVYLGPTGDDSRAEAEAIFQRAGMHSRPAILLLVSPERRRVEVLTAPEMRARVTDRICADVVAEMSELFARANITVGIIAGLQRLEAAAGPSSGTPPVDALPDLIEG